MAIVERQIRFLGLMIKKIALNVERAWLCFDDSRTRRICGAKGIAYAYN